MVGPGAELHALAAGGLQVAQVEVRGFGLKKDHGILLRAGVFVWFGKRRRLESPVQG